MAIDDVSFLLFRDSPLSNSHGSGKEGPRNGPDMQWHCSVAASGLRTTNERGDDSAEAVNGREGRIMLE
jgi:hypothetical protein